MFYPVNGAFAKWERQTDRQTDKLTDTHKHTRTDHYKKLVFLEN